MKKLSLLTLSLLFSCGLSAQWAAGVATIIPSNPYLGAYYQINQHWNVVANLRLQGLADDVKASPIVDASTAINGFMGLIYSF